jgi:hypothetical protein
MAALMASSSAFAGAKVTARVHVKSVRAKTVIMANSSGPKAVSAHVQHLFPGSIACARRAQGLQ